MTSIVGTAFPAPFVEPGTQTHCTRTRMDVCPPCLSDQSPQLNGTIPSKDQIDQDHPMLDSELPPSEGCRLAAINNFTLNKDEPQRGLQELVHALMEELEKGKKDLNRLYNIMMSYDYSGNEWKRYEFVDPNKKYTRNLIASVPGSFCLMLLCWNPEKGSPIHNHAGSECFMRVLQGKIVEKQYIVRNGEGDQSAKCNWNKITCSNIPPSDLIKSHQNIYTEGGCTFINDSLGVHQVENPYKEPAITLHAYIPGYDTCKSWCEDASATDPNKAIKIQQCTISFDTEQGEKPNH